MKLEVGKLYRYEKNYLMFYPDQETATAAERALGTTAVGVGAPAAAYWSAYWSKRFGKPVSYTEKNIPLLPLNNKKEYVEVLAGDRKGWIIYRDWLEIKEIV